MEFFFTIPPVHDRFVNIEAVISNPGNKEWMTLQLPSWRPGRYELGNFAKNLKHFSVSDADGSPLVFEKTSKDTWSIQANGGRITVRYSYYCAQLDAGACWLDQTQLYINPVHCCVFDPEQMGSPCKVHLAIPKGWRTATGMQKSDDHTLLAADFHELVDSPFICSGSLQHGSYIVNGIKFNIWIQGECDPDWSRILADFEGFTAAQLHTMSKFPANEFHFLVQATPHAFYHGVEHLTSTVLALGPGYKLMQKELYNDLLGVASHELFHCWNVKSIRPKEMLPYNYTRENYASTGYVYEGATTYYGDLFLGRSGFFTLQQMLDEFSVRLQKHMDNPGRNNYSVAESSFDTWLDGYVPGVPGRKVSIYDEGCLISWILDFMIRSATDSSRSLDDVMRTLYNDFALKGKGYTAQDYQTICEVVAGRDFAEFFSHYVGKASTLESLLAETVSLAGLMVESTPSPLAQENLYGIRTEQRNGNTFITSVYPGSPGHLAGLLKDDEIISVNNIRVENNLHDLCDLAKGKDSLWQIASSKKVRSVNMVSGEKQFLKKYKITPSEQMTAAQLKFREGWIAQ